MLIQFEQIRKKGTNYKILKKHIIECEANFLKKLCIPKIGVLINITSHRDPNCNFGKYMNNVDLVVSTLDYYVLIKNSNR